MVCQKILKQGRDDEGKHTKPYPYIILLSTCRVGSHTLELMKVTIYCKLPKILSPSSPPFYINFGSWEVDQYTQLAL